MSNILKELAITLEVTGGTEFSKAALLIFENRLSLYPEAAVLKALKRCQSELTGKLSLAAIIDRIETGHPGPEQAWGLMPKNEDDSAAVTQEMLRAWDVARPIYDEGDKVGARMAFKETYEREIAKGGEAKWIMSLGDDKNGRESAIESAIERGLIAPERRAALMPPERKESGVNPVIAALANKMRVTDTTPPRAPAPSLEPQLTKGDVANLSDKPR